MDSTFLTTDTLPLNLAERLLAFAIVALTLRPGRRGPSAWSNDTADPSTSPLHTLMCVLGPRRNYPDITAAALARCWWVDLDFASGVVGDVELLKIMDRLAQPQGEGSPKLPRRPLQWTHAAMDQASRRGFVDVLDWWYDRFGAACWYTEEALTGAAKAGHLETLKWWMDRKDALSCDFNNKILLRAALGGHSDICDWWLTHHRNDRDPSDDYCVHIMECLVYALIHAIQSNDAEFRMFHWWLAQPFSPKTQHVHIAYQLMLRDCILAHSNTSTAAIERIVDVLTSVDLPLLVNAVTGTWAVALLGDARTKWLDAHVSRVWEVFGTVSSAASSVGNLCALRWLAGHPMLGKLDELQLDKSDERQLDKIVLDSFKCAAGAGHVHVLRWWVSECPWFEKVWHAVDKQTAVHESSVAGHVHVLQWWKTESKLPYECSMRTLHAAAQAGHVSVLDWWVASGNISTSELKWWMDGVIRTASEYNRVAVLEWWSQQSQIDKHITYTDHDVCRNRHANGMH